MTIPADTPAGTRVRIKTTKQLIAEFGSLTSLAVWNEHLPDVLGMTATIRETETCLHWCTLTDFPPGTQEIVKYPLHNLCFSYSMLERDPITLREEVIKFLKAKHTTKVDHAYRTFCYLNQRG